MELKEWTKEQFLDSNDPYEYVYSFKANAFEHNRALEKVSIIASKSGYKSFKKSYESYVKSNKNTNKDIFIANVTRFTEQPLELESGIWECDDVGITCHGSYGEELIACVHPILPVERLTNIDTGIEKLKIAYRKGRKWREIISDKKTLASAAQIVSLADAGIAVNSESAKLMVKYLHDLENSNFDIIPEKNCVSRLGWIKDEGFSPYVDDLVFDGDQNLSNFFKSVTQAGDFKKWKEVMIKARRKNTINKIIMAASFTSVLIKHLGINNFMVHLWGETEVGKSVALMMAASVWANPTIGKYIQSFNSTVVGREYAAAFVNNLPLIMDELQVIKDKKQFDHDIYTLCEGAGKLRGNKFGGTSKTPTWENCIITNGEMPITSINSGGGAVNRIIEIECTESLFDDPREFCDIIKANYGQAGKYFVENIKMDEVKQVFNSFVVSLSKRDKTEKQAAAAAAILTADTFISHMFFDDDESLVVDDILPYLASKRDVCQNEKALNYMTDWICQNSSKFKESSQEIYGAIDTERVYIINNVFNNMCQEAGFNPTSFISFLKSRKIIDTGESKTTKPKRINGTLARCIWIRIDEASIVF